MKFVFVVGGSYKGFYINQLSKIKRVDLVVFNQDIFYEFDYVKEISGQGVVSSELVELNQKLKCPILVYGILNKNGERKKCFILCIKQKVSIINNVKDIYLYIKNKLVLLGNKIYKYSRAFATISMISTNVECQNFDKSLLKSAFVCDKKGVTYIKSGKIYRKFKKCCYFTLKK